MLFSSRNTCQMDRTRFLLKHAKTNTRMRMKIVIYFVNDEKVMQKQGFLNFDHIDQQSTCRRSPVTNNQRITYVHNIKSTDRGSS